MMNEGRIADEHWQRHFCELALKVTGAVQASRWAQTSDSTGFIYSFNGPQSLFCRYDAFVSGIGHFPSTRPCPDERT